jgi:hypothetical protein
MSKEISVYKNSGTEDRMRANRPIKKVAQTPQGPFVGTSGMFETEFIVSPNRIYGNTY